MLISFIISSQMREEKLFKTINTLKKQSNDSYELIIIADEINSPKESIDFVKDQFIENQRLSIIFNSRGQGNGLNWNNAIKIAKGDYLTLLKEGDIVEPNFVESIQNIIKSQNKKIDIIEVQFEKKDMVEETSKPLLKTNQLYNLIEDKYVFAYVTQEIYGKIFRNEFIKEFNISFKKNVRFDLLFLFMALAHAKTFYVSGNLMFKHRVSKPRYSVLDMLNQWPHILNYFRKIGSYKKYKDELNFAYYYGACYLYLNLCKSINNDLIYKKSLRKVSSKTNRKLKEFVNSNIMLDEKLVPEFYERINKFNLFIKTELSKKL